MLNLIANVAATAASAYLCLVAGGVIIRSARPYGADELERARARAAMIGGAAFIVLLGAIWW